jgi:hypothetical protein
MIMIGQVAAIVRKVEEQIAPRYERTTSSEWLTSYIAQANKLCAHE